MSLVFDLLTLQETDDRIAAMQASLASLQQRLSGNDALDHARREVQHFDERLAQVDRTQRKLEAEIADLNSHIEPEEKRLFSGEVRNPKELMSIQQEVDHFKRQRSRLEDQLIEAMSRRENIEPRREAAARKVADLESKWEHDQADLRREMRKVEEDITSEQERRNDQARAVPPRTLHLYEDLHRRKGGAAIARLQGSACTSCRLALPDAVRKQTMAREDITQCPNCERILAPG
ncbi:MAG: hypothetical protein U5Q44_00875 [Dehalococcoidia bacterium]|nr:hypothetical protein [Dehalococcoidia bacterium]